MPDPKEKRQAIFNFNDAVFGVGVGLLGGGIAFYSIPIAMIVVGGTLAAVSFINARVSV